jgi:hypothetical protein
MKETNLTRLVYQKTAPAHIPGCGRGLKQLGFNGAHTDVHCYVCLFCWCLKYIYMSILSVLNMCLITARKSILMHQNTRWIVRDFYLLMHYLGYLRAIIGISFKRNPKDSLGLQLSEHLILLNLMIHQLPQK